MASKSLGKLGEKRNLFGTQGKGDKPRTYGAKYQANLRDIFPAPREVNGFFPTGKPGHSRKVY